MLSFNDLALIAALASTGRPRRAAELLGTHPATIYRRLKALELQLGAVIFDKVAGTYVPSSVGDEILTRARDIETQLAELNRHLSGRDVRFMGTITVTTTDTLASRVSAALSAFRRVHPEIGLQLVTSNAMADMGRHEADVAVRPTLNPPETLVGRRVGAYGYGIYAARESGLVCSQPARASSGPWIGLNASLIGHPAARWVDAHVSSSRVVLRTNSMLTAMEAVRAGLGFALLPTYLADDPQYGLVRIGEEIAELRSHVWILMHPDLMRATRIKAFTNIMAKHLKPLLRGS
ncbi:MAG: LysR family transcriptional regulator [Thermomicrobiales bacterium]